MPCLKNRVARIFYVEANAKARFSIGNYGQDQSGLNCFIIKTKVGGSALLEAVHDRLGEPPRSYNMNHSN